jgi:hypothetical protein
MNLSALKDAVTSKTARQVLLGKKHSPKILFVAGTIGVVGTVVLACRATLKSQEMLENAELAKHSNNKRFKQGNISEEARDKADRAVQLRLIGDVAKNYALPVGLGLVSIGALAGGQIILTKRNGAIMAAYAALDRGYKEYRSRVVKEFGDEVDHRFATGEETVTVEEKLANGNTAISTTKTVTGKFGGSPYAVVFDERSRKFSKAPGQNASTIQMIQSFADHKLKAQGHLFLNEVLDSLDLPRTKEGAVVGWVYDMKDPNHKGDNYVDFGVFTGDEDLVEDFIDGKYYYVTLDFNVDGIIYDKI